MVRRNRASQIIHTVRYNIFHKVFNTTSPPIGLEDGVMDCHKVVESSNGIYLAL